MRVIGVDVGAETHVVAVVDEDGRTCSSQRRSPRMPKVMADCSS
jgi:hypothetical protein